VTAGGSICCICGLTFTARHPYGLCEKCYSKDRLREYDRVESAAKQAHRQGVSPITLVLPEWLSILSDWRGLCALCKRYSCSRILLFDPNQGLTYRNVIPACGACESHFTRGFDAAKEEARIYLREQTLPRFVPQCEEEYGHTEYQQ
jgi:hypothetical protein